MLYTREFLESVRSRLAPGGVYGQWFHVYESNSEVINLILRTYASVFPFVSAWHTGGPDLFLVGMDRSDRALDVRALEARFGQPDFTAAFGRVKIDPFPQLLAHEVLPLGMLHTEELEGPIHTVRWPRLSDFAARAFFMGGPVARIDPFMGVNHQMVSLSNSLLQRYAGGAEVLPEEILEIAARETCRFKRLKDCATWLARWSVDYPESELRRDMLPRLRKGARSRIPVLSPPRLERLHGIYSGQIVPSLDTPPPGEEARRVTDLFLRRYNHVVPFDRRVLEEVWARCDGEDCEVERAKVEGALWGLDESDSQ
jgi:hypothetical protein